jgi:hypothetical protein
MRNLLFNGLNGWQRLFVFWCLISTALAIVFVNATVDKNPEVSIFKYLPELPDYPCVKKASYDCSPLEIFLDPKYSKKFVLKDGTSHLLDNRYTDQQVENAHIQVKQKTQDIKDAALIAACKEAMFFLLCNWIAVYVIGWMIGWVWKGFKGVK